MRGIVLIPFFLLVLLGVGNGVPQIYTHFFRVPPVVGAPVVIPNAAAATPSPTLYRHRVPPVGAPVVIPDGAADATPAPTLYHHLSHWCRDTRQPGLCVDFFDGRGGACSCSEVVSNGWCWDPNFASQAAECKLSCNLCNQG